MGETPINPPLSFGCGGKNDCKEEMFNQSDNTASPQKLSSFVDWSPVADQQACEDQTSQTLIGYLKYALFYCF